MDNIVTIADTIPAPYLESMSNDLKNMGFEKEEIVRALKLLECVKKMIGS